MLIVCSSGNTYQNITYPAINPNVMAIGATTSANDRVDFSAYGEELSVVAPGKGIYGLSLNNTFVTVTVLLFLRLKFLELQL